MLPNGVVLTVFIGGVGTMPKLQEAGLSNCRLDNEPRESKNSWEAET
jgi:hypothetical protein